MSVVIKSSYNLVLHCTCYFLFELDHTCVHVYMYSNIMVHPYVFIHGCAYILPKMKVICRLELCLVALKNMVCATMLNYK